MDEATVNGEPQKEPNKDGKSRKETDTKIAENISSNGVEDSDSEYEENNTHGNANDSLSTITGEDNNLSDDDDADDEASANVDESIGRNDRPTGREDRYFGPYNQFALGDIRGRPTYQSKKVINNESPIRNHQRLRARLVNVIKNESPIRRIHQRLRAWLVNIGLFHRYYHWLPGLICALILIFFMFKPQILNGTSSPLFINKAKFLNFMKKEFPSQSAKELDIFAKQVDHCKKSTETDQQSIVYTLLHYKDPKTANDIGMYMAKYAASRFHNSSNIFSLDHPIRNDYFDTDLRSFKNKIKETGTLLVINFDKVNSQLARKFHMICDKYTPFIDEKAVYIVVLDTSDITLLEKDEISEWRKCAISTFQNLWPDLEDSALDPLIIRLTENIIKIYPEKE